ncbi:hypothetical protein [Halalkalicoccus tibetensis]|uniref:Uncharacterized protein n=1 Tax=Halalkalicoccus tibetensis TaxID=175632 RepID=A0ABD5V369_9EURY
MDITELAAELQADDPDLPRAEAAFVETVEAAQADLEAGEIDRDEYDERVARASDRYRNATESDG